MNVDRVYALKMGIDWIREMGAKPVVTEEAHALLIVNVLYSQLSIANREINEALAALNAPDESEGVPGSNEWADAYRVDNARKILEGLT